MSMDLLATFPTGGVTLGSLEGMLDGLATFPTGGDTLGASEGAPLELATFPIEGVTLGASEAVPVELATFPIGGVTLGGMEGVPSELFVKSLNSSTPIKETVTVTVLTEELKDWLATAGSSPSAPLLLTSSAIFCFFEDTSIAFFPFAAKSPNILPVCWPQEQETGGGKGHRSRTTVVRNHNIRFNR
ncbi:hypothetical protein B296_00032319 [Ensete ventricosum]|uniref:Uncharacterized protein n=1 Tax=Ensete ventricosum TaxID=4639 RepID=A0A427A6N2_ENSVE|nr:hypothetical protein B296_00032319 [Ensete ventricosum]